MKSTTTGGSKTEIKTCTCKSAFQDKLYGNGRRVFNLSQKKGNTFSICTVCGSKR